MFKSIRVGTGRASASFDVVLVESGASRLPRGLGLDHAKAFSAALETAGFKGGVGECVAVGAHGLIVGIGNRDDLTTDSARTIGAAIVRRLDSADIRKATLHTQAVPARQLDARTLGEALGEGVGLGHWQYLEHVGSVSKRTVAASTLTLESADADLRRGLKDGLVTADCVNETRRLAATPPNICHPKWMASEARRLARAAGLTCKVINYEQAQKLGMGGIVNVGRGSAVKPCLIILEHKPAKVRKKTTVALVGKTMTYDSGGYSLKIQGSMKGMKYDGNGGCAVLGAMLAIAARKLPVHTVGILPCAENMVSDDAYRPDDIITMYNGATVEVTNTDAEGRLILADALAYACKQYRPTAIIDAATLTGGIVVALGSWCAGLFANDDELVERVQGAADTTGERVWRMPVWDEHRDFMRSKHADLWNSGPKRDGHPIQGAAFLSFFVDDDVPWAHLDIAGTSAKDSDTGVTVPGPTGFGVRLLAEAVASYA